MNVHFEHDKIDITKLAIKAFLHSIPYARSCFSIQGDRDFIMARLIAACELPDEEV